MIVSMTVDELRFVIAAVSSMREPPGNCKLPHHVEIRRVLLRRLKAVRAFGERKPRKRVDRLYPFDKGYQRPRTWLKNGNPPSRVGPSKPIAREANTPTVIKVKVAPSVRLVPIQIKPRCVAPTRRGARCQKAPVTSATWDSHVGLCAVHVDWKG